MTIGVRSENDRVTCLDTSTVENAIDNCPYVWDGPNLSNRILVKEISCMFESAPRVLPQAADQL